MSKRIKQIVRDVFHEAWTHFKSFPKLITMVYDYWQFKRNHRKQLAERQGIIQPNFTHLLFSTDPSHKMYTPREPNPDQPLVVYVNGIWTHLEEAKKEVDILGSSRIGKQIDDNNYALMHNASRGIFWDLYDAIASRIWMRQSKAVEGLKRYIEHLYLTKNAQTIIIVGYSQGGIIASQAMNSLSDDIKDNLSIIFMSIAGAQDRLEPFPGEAHHIAHKGDYVAYTGVITHHQRGIIYGNLYTFDGNTHLLVKYMQNLEWIVDQASDSFLQSLFN